MVSYKYKTSEQILQYTNSLRGIDSRSRVLGEEQHKKYNGRSKYLYSFKEHTCRYRYMHAGVRRQQVDDLTHRNLYYA